ncbi:GrpB family protein [Neobacillus mesonae]|nr:GrpB family protein [Neobacillus mesonae]
MDDIVVVPYDPYWVTEAKEMGQMIRAALTEGAAVRIDHIGSTSVRGLAAKPIIDIQVSVHHLGLEELYKPGLESIGFIHRDSNPDLTKSYFREHPGTKRTHIHVREQGSWSEQLSLLFRDYLRVHQEDALLYEQEKYRLLQLYRRDRSMYVEEKGPIVWHILQKAHAWSMKAGWRPGPSDF